MLKKFFILLFSAFIFSGCSSKNNYETITFSSWGSTTEVKILKQIITDFEKENPNIKINFLHIPQNYFQKLHLLFASNTAPDVIFINNLYLPIYSSHLEVLDNCINTFEYYPQTINGLSYQGKFLAIPRDISNLVFYVNTDLIKQPNEIKNLEDLLKSAQNISNQDVWGISFEEDIYWASPYLSYFGEKFDRNFNAKTSKGLNFYKNLRDRYKIAPSKSQIGSSTLAQMFLDGKIAFYLSGRWMYPKISEKSRFNWIVIPFPNGEILQEADTSGWAMAKSSKHKESALKFIKYLASKESSKYFTESKLIVPARIDLSNILNENDHNEKAFINAIKISEARQVSKDYKKLVDNFNSTNF